MIFDQLRTDDFVYWTDALRSESHFLPTAQTWTYEPFDCVLQVIKITHKYGDAVIYLDCVVSCGQHEVISLDRDAYETARDILGEDMLRYASIEEISNLYIVAKEADYDLEEDIGYILGLLQNGKLSVQRERGM